ncbi:MAG: hypothetical protein U5K54_02500 [Cytophagales bacterium]|nr:hypothetical protein [Cytophagales bacterium]
MKELKLDSVAQEDPIKLAEFEAKIAHGEKIEPCRSDASAYIVSNLYA